VQEASLYFPASLDAGFQGDAFFTSPNPPVGATFTYYVGRAPQSRKQKRQEAEKAAIKKNEDITPPTWEELRAEDREESPSIVLTVTDETGNVVRRLSGPASKGFQRVTWDMRLPSATPVTAIARGDDDDLTALFGGPTGGPLVAPGSYRVQLAKRVDGVLTPLGAPQTFAAAPLAEPTLGAPDRTARLAFQQRVAKLQRAVLGSAQALTEATTRLAILKQAVDQAPGADSALRNEIVAVEDKARALQNELTGDRVIATRSEPTAPGIQDRVGNIVQGSWSYSGAPTATNRRDYDIAAQQFSGWLGKIFGGPWKQWHFWSGYAVLALLIFRIALSEQTSGAFAFFQALGLQNDQMQALSLVILASSVLGGLVCAAIVKPNREHAIHIVALSLLILGAVMDSRATNLTRPAEMYLSQALIAFAGALFLPPAMAAGLMMALQKGPTYILSFVIVFLTTDPTDLADSLIQHGHASPRFAIGALASFRLVGTLRQEWDQIRMARRARGLRSAFARSVFVLLVGAIRRGVRLSVAMDARGFDSRIKRTVARPQSFTYKDVALILGAVALGALALIAGQRDWV